MAAERRAATDAITPPQDPMLARPASEPIGASYTGRYAFEPKFDGYRAILFITTSGCLVQSRGGHDITRCFPDIADAATKQVEPGTVLEGELVVWSERDACLDFAALQRRIVSPARAAALAVEQPATFMAFDVLAKRGADLRPQTLRARRERLERCAASWVPPLQLVPQTTDPQLARRWMEDYAAAPVGVEGIVAKELAERYKPGMRAWLKLRIRHTAEAIVGAVTGSLESPLRLVLALPGAAGNLLVAGATTPLNRAESRQVAALLIPSRQGHPWPPELPAGRMGQYARESVPVTLVEPALVVEVEVDTAYEFGKWRHPTRFLRVRPDLAPHDVQTPPH